MNEAQINENTRALKEIAENAKGIHELKSSQITKESLVVVNIEGQAYKATVADIIDTEPLITSITDIRKAVESNDSRINYLYDRQQAIFKVVDDLDNLGAGEVYFDATSSSKRDYMCMSIDSINGVFFSDDILGSLNSYCLVEFYLPSEKIRFFTKTYIDPDLTGYEGNYFKIGLSLGIANSFNQYIGDEINIAFELRLNQTEIYKVIDDLRQEFSEKLNITDISQLTDNKGLLKKFIAKEYIEYDNVNRQFTTERSDGFETKKITIREGFDFAFKFELPVKSYELAWSGADTQILLNINEEGYQEYGNTGFSLGNASSARIQSREIQTIYITREQLGIGNSDFTLQIKLRHQTVKGKLTINKDVKASRPELASIYTIKEVMR